ncbi:restriction endonuclease subunit S [Psychrobacter sp.]|uniref:restriction endonuclease subunit S n=1 Tax=Psychrobacter sp. TaxID=56811 RepID=UPI003F99013C
MSELRRYPEYKDSGVPWLGEIPSHWEAKRMRFFVNTNPLKSELGIQEGLLVSFVPMESVAVDGGLTLTTDKEISDVYKGYTYFRNDDVVMAKITPCFENGKASICNNLTNDIGFGTTELHVLRPKEETSSRFLFYLIRSDVFMKIGESEMYGAGGQKRVPESFIKNFVAPLPDIDEQQAIVNFLDDKLNHIDTLISKQQQLIEKLAEQRSAVITHAVTKGLNPDVPMKDSGVEWLGEIPEHWDSFKITHLVETIGSGTTPKSSNSNYYADEGTLWVTTSELRESVIADTKKKLTEDALQDYSTLKVFPINSVAIAMYGATIGRLGILGEEATFNQACCVYSESEKIHYKFLYYWLWYRRPILISLSNGGGQPNLNQDDLRKLVIPIPAIKEQEEIVNYLDNKTQKIDKMSEATTDIITKLQEYRAALITQAVTGKIDVRYLNQQAS